ncbi:hypothetical protein [Amycolatopsis acididurans]|uniref:hypothetical protein n=1 Tax=Amycolatopsis acididurans TaxID=2724524 RepID=UPI001FEA84BA|nr:hypothetical protein [Amycolatopsis acididurans]
MSTTQRETAVRLDRLPVTPPHRYVIAVLGVATFFDLYDPFPRQQGKHVLSREFGVSSDELKPLLASGSSARSSARSHCAGSPTGWAGAQRFC